MFLFFWRVHFGCLRPSDRPVSLPSSFPWIQVWYVFKWLLETLLVWALRALQLWPHHILQWHLWPGKWPKGENLFVKCVAQGAQMRQNRHKIWFSSRGSAWLVLVHRSLTGFGAYSFYLTVGQFHGYIVAITWRFEFENKASEKCFIVEKGGLWLQFNCEVHCEVRVKFYCYFSVGYCLATLPLFVRS